MPEPKPAIAKVKYDGEVALSIGRSRKETSWKNRTAIWSKLVDRLSNTTRTSESFAAYRKASKAEQTEIKDVGGFVAGAVKQGRRKAGNIANRSMLTLDMDHVTEPVDEIWDKIALIEGFACVMYSTHSHTPESPRLRLVIPLARPVMSDEYQAIGRMVAKEIGIDQFDDTTYEPHRLMYWPSTAQDAEYVFKFNDAPWLDPDSVLAKYPDDWRDVSFWPESSRQSARLVGQMERQEDPLEKGGIIGAFCKTYTITEAIATFLSEIYTPTAQEDRYTYAKGTTSSGVVVYDDKWTFSHHGTDPTSGLLCNAFDLIRIHRFGARDDDAKPNTPVNRLPSFSAMSDFAAKDARVKEIIASERLAQVAEDFDLDQTDVEIDTSWTKKLEFNRKGDIASTINNVLIILENDENLKGKFAFNEFANRVTVFERLPWSDKVNRDWDDSDDAGVRHYVESVYSITGAGKISDAVTLSFNRNRFHPVQDYLKGLEWDGVPRVDTLLIDYMGAEDTEYVRFVTRKWLCGAVARILKPGIKFDYMLVLTGEQGIYKSTFFRLLAKDWFTDSLQDVEGNQAVEKLMGSWIIEFGELQAFNRSEANAIKRFITSQEDRTRLAYDRRTSHLPRQCVFAGTTNRKDFLKDDTGNRRFWPVEVRTAGRMKDVILDLEEEVDQIWAEALHFWKVEQESLYPNRRQEAMAYKAREAHREVNEKEGLILDYLDKLLPDNWGELSIYQRRQFLRGETEMIPVNIRQHVCVLEIWCECLEKNQPDIQRRDSLEIAGILNGLDGWKASGRQYMGLYGQQRVNKRLET